MGGGMSLRRIGSTTSTPEESLQAWIDGSSFSCLGARAALKQGSLSTVRLADMRSADEAAKLHGELKRFAAHRLGQDKDFATLVAIFTEPVTMSETDFERVLWQLLAHVHEVDRASHPWAADASPDVEATDFAFSAAGHPFFVVGMHGGAARTSRRFSYPAVAFNSSRQFARLRETGVYTGLQGKIRLRELLLQGSINPNLAAFASFAEARQYAGRATSEAWTCPATFGAP
jgi:FPC/CPF motif-containing protein YcgG